MKHWRTWETRAAFDAWHTTVVYGMNLPRVGVNQATGEPQPDAQWTTAYTQVTEISSSDWRAPVEDDIAEVYQNGIGDISEPPPTPDIDI